MPINRNIISKEVLLIDNNGEKKGLVPTIEAIELSEKLNLDLVQVSPKSAVPVVCKIMNYGKYVFDKKKSSSTSNSKVKKTSLKEIKFRPNTDVADFNIKLKKIKSFINDGNKTKISVRFRGREILNSNLGLDLLERVKLSSSDIAQVDQEPSLEGRQLLMILSPLKRK